MKNKSYIFIPILLIIILFTVIDPVEAFYYNLLSLETDKELYFVDESIKINASWELNYNIKNEISYIQIHIINDFDQIIWNSSKYNDIGVNQDNWTVPIANLILDSNISSFILYVKLFLFYFHKEIMNTIRTYLETIKISVIKRNVSCQLTGYKEHLKFGEAISFSAFFFYVSSGITQNFYNQTVNFMISFSGQIIHQQNYTTINSGVIYVHLCSFTNLRLGENILTFSIYNNPNFNDTSFRYSLFVEKSQLNFEIITFKNYLEKNEDLEIKLYFYYFFNQTEIPLTTHTIIIKIFDNNNITFFNEYNTDNNGILYLIISQELFLYNQKSQELMLSICFNGTDSINNKTLTLGFNIEQNSVLNLSNSFQIKVLSFCTALIIISILLSYIIIKRRNRDETLLSELVIKY
ncbi:MAG: hypothetical protein ACFFEY_15820 [Candidatus Thorarchaeota archaeon]